ncbi:hypothetical protein GCM10020366_32590 [Saccharopolyspora gregorii]|uniref:Uncharacterized protein n=1 Tax=Saccharopolyspora gregorii TaxID=33914 RepID=A0ABP6RRY7_9PSEU
MSHAVHHTPPNATAPSTNSTQYSVIARLPGPQRVTASGGPGTGRGDDPSEPRRLIAGRDRGTELAAHDRNVQPGRVTLRHVGTGP